MKALLAYRPIRTVYQSMQIGFEESNACGITARQTANTLHPCTATVPENQITVNGDNAKDYSNGTPGMPRKAHNVDYTHTHTRVHAAQHRDRSVLTAQQTNSAGKQERLRNLQKKQETWKYAC